MIQQTIFSGRGLNTDDALEYVPLGDSPYSLHLMIEDGQWGARVNMKGNRRIEYKRPLNLSRVYFTIGSYYNSLRREVYYFVFSQPYDSGSGVYLYDNRLLRFKEDSEEIETIFIDEKNYFGIDPTHPLTDVKMLGSWLFFNPVTSEPRMIDVDMAYNYTNYEALDDDDLSFSAMRGSYFTWRGGLWVTTDDVVAGELPSTHPAKWERVGNSYQDESAITDTEMSLCFLLIKPPPVDRLKVSYGTDPDKYYNNLRGKLYRFCHRYKYFDDSYSVCSRWSDIALPDSDEIYNGELPGDITQNNYIKIEFSLYSAALIKSVEILFQEVGGDWKRVAVIDRQDTSLLNTIYYSFDFYNDKAYETIDSAIPLKIYDVVPKKANAMELIGKNILCFGGVTEGFDNIPDSDIDVELTIGYEEISIPQITTSVIRDLIASNDITTVSTYYPGAGYYYQRIIDLTSWSPLVTVHSGDYFEIRLGRFHIMEEVSAADLVDEKALINFVYNCIKKAGWTDVSQTRYVVSVNNYWSWPPAITVCRFIQTSGDELILHKESGFKTGAEHPFCLFYFFSGGRRSNAIVHEDMSVYVPSLNETSPLVPDVRAKYYIEWAINHAPPEGAESWCFGYAGNKRCTDFVQYIISSAADGSSEIAGTTKLDITPLTTIATTTTANWNRFPNSIIGWEFQTGDRVRILTESTTPSTPGTRLGQVIPGVYDYEIIHFDATNSLIYIRANYTVLSALNVGENSLIEIYRPLLTGTETVYYEFGPRYPIILDEDGNKVHAGGYQSQSLTVSPRPATGRFTYGDIYYISRTPSKPLCTSVGETIAYDIFESAWWSDFYESDQWSQGKPGVRSPIGEKTLNFIRYSNIYLQGTELNGLSTFDPLSYKELNDMHGPIVRMVEAGNTLKIYQSRKASSIGIGRAEYMDAEGQITIVGADNVLGLVRYSNTDYSTIFPESIVKNNRHIYFFDVYSGTVCRDAPNGITSICGETSEGGGYKMQQWAKEKARNLLRYGVDNVRVISCWDEAQECLYMTFIDKVDSSNNTTIVFHEPTNRWITFAEFEYTPENGWNDMLELEWTVVKGFENGIGLEFNELTRFYEFDIGSGSGTPPNINIFPPSGEITIEAVNPTFSIGADVDQEEASLTTVAVDPSFEVFQVETSESSLSWGAQEYEADNKKTFTITLTGSSSVTLYSLPSWMACVRYNDSAWEFISEGFSVPDGSIIGVYPLNANTGGVRTGNVVFRDAYNDSATVSVTQQAPDSSPYVIIAMDDEDTTGTTIGDKYGVAYAYTPYVSIYFTPNCPLYGYYVNFTMSYEVFVNGNSVKTGSLTNIINQSYNYSQITLDSNIGENDAIHVILNVPV